MNRALSGFSTAVQSGETRRARWDEGGHEEMHSRWDEGVTKKCTRLALRATFVPSCTSCLTILRAKDIVLSRASNKSDTYRFGRERLHSVSHHSRQRAERL